MPIQQYVSDLIDNVAKKEKFIDFKIDLNAGSKHGDNFSGELVAIKLRGTIEINGERNNDAKHLLLKLTPNNPSRRQIYHSLSAFEREIELYSIVLPAFVQFQKDKGLSGSELFTSFVKVHAFICDRSNDQFALILDDLRAKNYEMYPKDKSTTYDHAKLVVNGLGKFHAISFALKDQKPKLFESFKRNFIMIDMLKSGLSKDNLCMFDRCISILNDQHHKRLFEELKTNAVETLEEYTIDEYIGDSGVILHGDCWNNNLMFQYENNKPKDVMFLDWQLSHYGSPVCDLFYFLFSATDQEFRHKHYQQLLREYHETLSSNIRKLGSDPDKLYPIIKFQDDLVKFGRFPLIFAPLLTQFCHVDQSLIADIDEYCDELHNGQVSMIVKEFDVKTHNLFDKIFNETITDIVNFCKIK